MIHSGPHYLETFLELHITADFLFKKNSHRGAVLNTAWLGQQTQQYKTSYCSEGAADSSMAL